MSTISASTTSTTAYKVTADTTGTLVLQTGSTPTTAATIDANQNVGINNPSSTIRTKLMVSSSNSSDTLTVGTVSGGFSITNTNSAYGLQFGSLSTGNSWIQSARMDGTATAYNLLLQSGGGNVGIGTTSPNYKLEVASGTGAYTDIAVFRTAEATSTSNAGGGFSAIPSATAGSRIAYMWLDADGANFSGSDYFYIQKTGNSGQADLVQSSNSPMTFKIASSEVARFDTSGNFIVNSATSFPFGNVRAVQLTGSSNGSVEIAHSTGNFGGDPYARFYYNGGQIGSITQSGTTAVAYNTSSDYRLKNSIAPMTGALAKVAQLKPVTYRWNADDSEGEGFIAHELAEVCPHAVTGEKDGTRIEQYEISPAVPATYDEDGNELTPAVEAVMGEREVPAYQGIDTSFLVATLTAAIQEQQAIIETLTNRITALEAK